MKRFLPILLLLTACTAPQRDLTLHYDRPATYFEEALPVGNGRLGAMVYGNPVHERLSLNDITLWTGEPDKGPEHPAKESHSHIRYPSAMESGCLPSLA